MEKGPFEKVCTLFFINEVFTKRELTDKIKTQLVSLKLKYFHCCSAVCTCLCVGRETGHEKD